MIGLLNVIANLLNRNIAEFFAFQISNAIHQHTKPRDYFYQMRRLHNANS
jgi:hypothetical protein